MKKLTIRENIENSKEPFLDDEPDIVRKAPREMEINKQSKLNKYSTADTL